jgi:NADH dehydrogenase FAD-containing subunit
VLHAKVRHEPAEPPRGAERRDRRRARSADLPARAAPGRRLASNLRGAVKPYRYRTRGQLATLGRRHGIAVLGAVKVRGVLGWAVARGYHLLQLPFTSRRARVLAEWTAAAVFRRDVAELSLARESA